jgi:hypothetical protein
MAWTLTVGCAAAWNGSERASGCSQTSRLSDTPAGAPAAACLTMSAQHWHHARQHLTAQLSCRQLYESGHDS